MNARTLNLYRKNERMERILLVFGDVLVLISCRYNLAVKGKELAVFSLSGDEIELNLYCLD